MVVVENVDGGEGVGHVEVGGDVTDAFEGSGAFVGGHDLRFARALGGLFLSDRFPGDRTTAVADVKARKGEKFEKF